MGNHTAGAGGTGGAEAGEAGDITASSDGDGVGSRINTGGSEGAQVGVGSANNRGGSNHTEASGLTGEVAGTTDIDDGVIHTEHSLTAIGQGIAVDAFGCATNGAGAEAKQGARAGTVGDTAAYRDAAAVETNNRRSVGVGISRAVDGGGRSDGGGLSRKVGAGDAASGDGPGQVLAHCDRGGFSARHITAEGIGESGAVYSVSCSTNAGDSGAAEGAAAADTDGAVSAQDSANTNHAAEGAVRQGGRTVGGGSRGLQSEVCNSSNRAAGTNGDVGVVDTEGVTTSAVGCSSTGGGAGCSQHIGDAAERGGRSGPYVEAAISEAEHSARFGISNRVGIGAGGGAGQIGDRVSVQRAAGTYDDRGRATD